jgi:hypothetical protein
MADTKISAETTIAQPPNAAWVPIVDTTNKKTTVGELRGSGYTAHGATGATETIDPAVKWHSLTLDTDCTLTFTGWPATGISCTFILEILQDGTGGRTITWPAAVVSAPTINPAANGVTIVSLSSRDGGTTVYAMSNEERSDAYTTTATAAGTTTLTVNSARIQFFTGVTTQTVTLPVASTLELGFEFVVVNNSTGVVTVNSSGANAVLAMVAGSRATFTCILTSGTSAASWDAKYIGNTNNPMTAAADIIVGGTSGAPARLAKGTSLQGLRMNVGATAQEYGTPGLFTMSISFNPKAVCDGTIDRLFLMKVGAGFPNGIKITEWYCSFDADPATEVDLDLKRADAFIGVANAAVMDVLDTTNGASSETTAANINGDAAVANGKVIYLEFGTAYSADNLQINFQMSGYAV